ncbi:MAG TPA: ABC transporter substrate-binding protein [Nocardioides sp.]|uniref:ABC transporter substrate-binding protein n=1 Tax=Nocardioides sp. TaxID=35761 RepID=UPI002ED9A33C
MRSRNLRRGSAIAASLAAASLVLAACGGGDDDEGGTAGGTSPGEGKAECEQLTQFGDLTGRSVHVYTTIVAPEDKPHKDSYKLFTECTGAEVEYEGSKEMEAQILVRAQSGNLPDVAFIPQPGLLNTLVTQTDTVVEVPDPVEENVDEFWGEDWKGYGSVDGTLYAAPLGANVKSFVWYSPKMFTDNGWTIPETWDDLMALSDTIAGTGIKPWCAGIESGEATGWPATDWLEDVMLRTAGPEAYDDWITHDLAFNDQQVVEALDTVGAILKDPKYVNGGIGDVKSIATKAFQEAGLPILDGKCALHRQASFYSANWPEGTTIAEDGDVFAFYLPGTGEEKPVLGGGEFVAAFNDKPETQAFQTYLSTDTWANEKVKLHPQGGWVSANKGLDIANIASPIDQLSAQILQDPEAVFRFDASDLMPAEVGSNSFWKQMVAWITGQDTQTTLDNIEESWPSS